MELLRLHELTAVNTLFQPRHGKEVHTFLQTAPQGGEEACGQGQDNDFGEYVGSQCKVKYHGKLIGGRVKAVFGGKKKKKWVIQFDDRSAAETTRGLAVRVATTLVAASV